MMTSTYNRILFLMVALAVTSCQKDIEITPLPYAGQLYIEGILFPGQEPRIFVSKSLPFFDAKVTPQQTFARGATVRITNGSETEMLAPDSTFDKFRCRWTPFYKGNIPSQTGQTYTLTVSYENKTYTAVTTINQAKVTLSSVEYIADFYDIYGGHDGVILNFNDVAGQNNYYRFQMDRMIDTTRHHAHVLDVLQNNCTNGEKFEVTDYGRTIFSDKNADGQPLKLFIEVSFEYQEGDSAWVFVQSLDKNSAEFFQQLDNQLESILNPFVEPVFLDTKIEGCIGVFGSAVLSDSVLFIYPQDNP